LPIEQFGALLIGRAVDARAAFMARVEHLVAERHRIVKRWLSERWDGPHGNGPAWNDPVKLAVW